MKMEEQLDKVLDELFTIPGAVDKIWDRLRKQGKPEPDSPAIAYAKELAQKKIKSMEGIKKIMQEAREGKIFGRD